MAQPGASRLLKNATFSKLLALYVVYGYHAWTKTIPSERDVFVERGDDDSRTTPDPRDQADAERSAAWYGFALRRDVRRGWAALDSTGTTVALESADGAVYDSFGTAVL